MTGTPPRSPWRRAFGLAAAFGTGIAVGLLGRAWTGEDAWFLAVPLAVALGWWLVADPTRCDTPPGAGRGDERRPR